MERMMTSFVAIDFETANGSLASICQVGIVVYQDGKEVDTFSTLVNPEEEFWGMNIFIHGIEPDDVVHAPKFPEIYDELRKRLSGNFVLSHGWFDRSCLAQVQEKYGLPDFEKDWLDATRIVRRALPQFSKRGYGLQNLAEHYGLLTNAHDALNDAQTCGVILLKILSDTGTELEEWVHRVNEPITPRLSSTELREILKPNGGGLHYGESIVFTGSLSIPQLLAQERASKAGFGVEGNVTKKTDYLVCGVQDLDKLVGHEISSKERKARDLIANGQRIRLLNEADFFQICECAQ